MLQAFRFQARTVAGVRMNSINRMARHGRRTIFSIFTSASAGLQARYDLHPEPRGLQRMFASAEAWGVKLVSESGRLVGHLKRGRPWNLVRGFDWFLSQDAATVRHEKLQAARRLAVLAAAAFLAASPLLY